MAVTLVARIEIPEALITRGGKPRRREGHSPEPPSEEVITFTERAQYYMPLDVTTIIGFGEAVSCVYMSWCADGDAASMGGNPPVVLRIPVPDKRSVAGCLLVLSARYMFCRCVSVYVCIRGYAAIVRFRTHE